MIVRGSPRQIVVAWVATVVLLLASACSDNGADVGRSDAESPSAPTSAPTRAEPGLNTLFGRLPELSAEVGASVVTIFAGEGVGSGVVYDGNGTIVSNAHVVANAERVQIGLANGQRVRGVVLAADRATDLAVIRTDQQDLPPAEFASSLPERGTSVAAIGSPLGLENSVTAGVVSGLGRILPGAERAPALVDLIQTDAAISPGNSGGALINADGKVVGINDAYIPPTAGAVSVGFAIPAPTVTDTVDELLADGRAQHPYLGVTAAPLSPRLAESRETGTTRGVVVIDVRASSPADRAGVRPGDVITAIDDTEITAMGDLFGAIRDYDPKESASIKIRRNNETHALDVTFGRLTEARR